ncbi:scytonemin biosynthesis cyclase/decarboxylase ScyC [Streptosporangiaceae bacterium NEAU-GS5]|nr:scytonemin biosynthesis cyclase/decarboxylase ScyC [Streptosporangiaceae bacterium NEAU-GS5]
MEANTFATSAYIAAPYQRIVDYLADLQNLNEWTLFSRMRSQVDESTWLGTASGYQRPLYYHVRRGGHDAFQWIEWHCGFEEGVYHQVYPVLILPPEYVAPAEREPGAYVHWVSFADPARRTPMIAEGMPAVHRAECRALKAALERGAGMRRAARGRHVVRSETIYVDAPIGSGVEYLRDLRSMKEYAFLLRPDGEILADEGTFLDEYGRRVVLRSRSHAMGEASIVEHEACYPDDGGFAQRSLTLLVPCSYAFGQSEARGFIKHRVTFWPADESQELGRTSIDELRAESVNVKRLLEAKEGNLESFARGFSYQPV